MRVFAALVPPADVIEHLDDFLDVRREHGDLRWAGAEQFHVTLAFAASTSETVVDDWAERLSQSLGRRTPFEAALGGGGAFPDAARAKVLWVGVTAPEGAVEALAVNARNAANASGIAVDGARFRPHLTVARLGFPIDVTRWIRILDSYEGPAWTVDTVTLLQSHLGEGPRRRPRYEPLAELPLGG
ncbi:RNA 2',3'-cyclic phosphodiesterase [Nocardioides sp. Kera G14]|uniref:RNA 2',3'-cyclic phosphodiesterase n=1 Tax=Nocardioides sp. Kera G14 TaxID=2884264 RepID=UPI001D124A78|nr:RNA 2',3'-cyclic phosphodiesterase [Nocardioides sp. Kera G14]UDY23280.1 RNA 2',3'-cyclic phosphodiesterase [Nocardioides sp. Kera G14]